MIASRSPIFCRNIVILVSLLFVFLGALRPAFSVEPSGGIGVILEFLPDKKIHRIRAVFQGSPAAKAHLKPGDEIIAVDGLPTAKMSFEELGKKVRGEPGQPIRLTLRSAGSGETREIPLIRVSGKTVSPLIEGGPLSGSGGQRSSSFLSEPEKSAVKEVIRRLKTSQDRQKMQKLLIDFKEGRLTKPEFFNQIKSDFK